MLDPQYSLSSSVLVIAAIVIALAAYVFGWCARGQHETIENAFCRAEAFAIGFRLARDRAESALADLESAASETLEAIDAHNEKHGTFWISPAFLRLGAAIASARAARR